jgi:predicted outer membrane repeat protein
VTKKLHADRMSRQPPGYFGGTDDNRSQSNNDNRRLANVEVHSWAQASASIANITSGLTGTVTFAADFDCSDYTAEIVVSGNVTVRGNGAVCDAGQNGRFFWLNSERSALALDSMTLKNGSADVGGAIWNNYLDGTLAIGNSSFISNTATGYRGIGGGAIYTLGDLTIASSFFTSNKANPAGGAIFRDGGGMVAIETSYFTSNSATQ